MPFIAILTDGHSVAFIRNTNPKRKRHLTTRFSEAKRFTELGKLILRTELERHLARKGALLEFHRVRK